LPIDSSDLLARAEAAGVTFVKGTDFFLPGGGGDRSARLAFSYASPEEIREGVRRLAELVPAEETVETR
jgi:2-aminoadipate transaminase